MDLKNGVKLQIYMGRESVTTKFRSHLLFLLRLCYLTFEYFF